MKRGSEIAQRSSLTTLVMLHCLAYNLEYGRRNNNRSWGHYYLKISTEGSEVPNIIQKCFEYQRLETKG